MSSRVWFEGGPIAGWHDNVFDKRVDVVGAGHYYLDEWPIYEWHDDRLPLVIHAREAHKRELEAVLKGMDEKQAPVGNSGGVRSTEDGKMDYTLIMDGPMYDRWAAWMTEGAKKYEARNWMLFDTQEAKLRAARSLARHFRAYMRGDQDEDHAAAIFFNVNAIEYITSRLDAQANEGSCPI